MDKKVKVLSGGEKSRLAMIRLMLEPVNFLILDEPTNHLDMTSKEILKNALADFAGTVLVVSHDRDFLDGLVDCVYEFKNKKIKQHLGGIYDFLEKKKIESLKELEVKNTSKAKDISFEEKKQINKTISKIEKQVENTELKIAQLENEIANIDSLLSSPKKLDDHSVFDSYNDLKNKLEATMESWEEQQEKLETWKAKKTW